MLENCDFLLQRTLYKEDPVLHKNLNSIILSSARNLSRTDINFPQYTDHSLRHSLILIDFFDRLIGSDNIDKFNVDEIYILLCAGVLHDLGMATNPSLLSMSPFIDIVGSQTLNDPDTDITDTIREFHQELSAHFVLRFRDLIGFPTPEHAYCIAQIIRGHRKSDLFDTNEFPPEYELPNGNIVHVQYLAAIVRLADELDIAQDRNPQYAYQFHVDSLPFRQHYAIKHVDMLPEKFVMYIVSDEQDVLDSCGQAARKLEENLQYCRKVIDLSHFTLTQRHIEMNVNNAHFTAKRKVRVLDTDMGIDDAMAILLIRFMGKRMPHFVVVTAGNTSLDNGVRNLLALRKLLGLEFTVVRGRDVELVPTETGDTFHGIDGLANIGEAFAKRVGLTEDELKDYITYDEFKDLLSYYEAFEYTAIGPLTNICELLNDDKLRDKISNLYIMGGGISEFNSPHDTEFNFAKDPQAVRQVLSSGKNITLFPLDLTNRQRISPRQAAELSHSPYFPEAGTLLEYNMKSNEKYNGIPASVLHDTMPILYQCNPELFEVEDAQLEVDEYGSTIRSDNGYPIHVATDVSPGLMFDKLKILLFP